MSDDSPLLLLRRSTVCDVSIGDICNDSDLAQRWAVAALFLILLGGSIGVLLPLLSRRVQWFGVGSAPFVMGRAFAGGVVLSTGFVHMFPGAQNALSSSCLGWGTYPWASCLAVLAVLCTNVVEFVVGQYFYEQGQDSTATNIVAMHSCGHLHATEDEGCSASLMRGADADGMAISREQKEFPDEVLPLINVQACSTHMQGQEHTTAREGTAAVHDRAWSRARKLAVAHILEIGIAMHSVLIGVALGVSPSPCTIRPLAAALVLHQTFEGFALGATLIDAEYSTTPFLLMALLFSLTTPGGVALGLGIRSTYNDSSPTALAVSGAFDSVSTGILIYMALVDLIAVDFFGERMRKAEASHQFCAYMFLFAGASAMALLAKWA